MVSRQVPGGGDPDQLVPPVAVFLNGASGFPVVFLIGPRARTHTEGRLSRAMKGIRVSVSVKSATKCTIKRVLRALLTLPRTLKRTLNRGTYSDTLNRSAYSIRLTQRHSSIENPTMLRGRIFTFDIAPPHIS